MQIKFPPDTFENITEDSAEQTPLKIPAAAATMDFDEKSSQNDQNENPELDQLNNDFFY